MPCLRIDFRAMPLSTNHCITSQPQACWYVIEFHRVFSTWNDFLEEYSCGHLTVYILVSERDTNKSFLWICFSCHFKRQRNAETPVHAHVKMFEETVFLTLLNLVVSEANIHYIQTLRLSFLNELLGLNIILKEAADRYRAHIARTY